MMMWRKKLPSPPKLSVFYQLSLREGIHTMLLEKPRSCALPSMLGQTISRSSASTPDKRMPIGSRMPIYLFFILACAIVPGYGQKGNENCSNDFKGKVIRLEYLYSGFKSHWLHGPYNFTLTQDWPIGVRFAQRDKIYDHSEGMSWLLHDCGGGYVCFENMGNRNHYIKDVWSETSLVQNYLSKVPRDVEDGHRFEIFCDSCKLSNRCQVYTKSGQKMYAANYYAANRCESCGYDDWFDWEVVLLVPMEHWQVVDVGANCNHSPNTISTHFEVKQTVGASKKVTETHGMSLELSYSMASNPLTWNWGFKATHAREWSLEKLQTEERSTAVTIRGVKGLDGIETKPGKRVLLKQLVGVYGEPGDLTSGFKFKTNSLITAEEDC